MRKQNLACVATVILLLAAVTSCKKPAGFEYRGINNVKLENVSMQRSTVLLNMVYYNPNSFGVNLKHVDCDVYVDSSYVGKYVLDTLMHIDRKAEFTIPTRMDVDMRSLMKGGMAALFGNQVQITVKGTSRVGKGGLFVNVPFDFSGKYSIPLF